MSADHCRSIERAGPTERNGSTVTVRARSSDPAGGVEFSVADRGPGIPSHERAFLTEGEETPLVHGSGLGFWLVRMVARRVNGRIEVRDREPTGSVVALTVPLAIEPSAGT